MQKRFLSILIALASIGLLRAQAPQPNPKDPQYQAKGDQKRTYLFPGTGESIPYHLYVPSKWTTTTRLPLAAAPPDLPPPKSRFGSTGVAVGVLSCSAEEAVAARLIKRRSPASRRLGVNPCL